MFVCVTIHICLSDETMCDAEALVRRNTVLETAPMKPLKLNCTITWKDCSKEPAVTWCKLRGDTCKKVNRTHHVTITQERRAGNELVHYLNFHHVTKHNGGQYRCEILGSTTVVSHAITVSVLGESNKPFFTGKTVTN